MIRNSQSKINRGKQSGGNILGWQNNYISALKSRMNLASLKNRRQSYEASTWATQKQQKIRSEK